MPGWVRDDPAGAVIELVVQPRASRTRVVGEHDGRLKLQIAAPPVDGEANAEVIAFLAGALRVRRAAILLLRGDAGRRKTVRIEGVSAAQVTSALAPDR